MRDINKDYNHYYNRYLAAYFNKSKILLKKDK